MMSESRSLPPDEAAEDLVGSARAAHDQIRSPLAQNAIEQLAAAGKALLLHRQQVDGDDDADDEVFRKDHHAEDAADDAAGDAREHLLRAGENLLGQQTERVPDSTAQG